MLSANRIILLAKVDEMGSITAAAQAMNYTPSAVSQQLRKLETEVGQPLLRRLPDGVVPNDAGLVLIEYAKRIEAQLAAAEADLAEVAGLRRGKLAIGTFSTIGSSFLPIVVRRFKQLHPGIDLMVKSAHLDDLQERLSSGEVNMSLLWDYSWAQIPQERFALTKMFDDPTVLLVSADHRLAKRKSVEMSELAEEAWVVREGQTRVSEVLERCSNAAGFSPRLAVHANDYQEAQAMVSVGLGIAIAPLTAVANRRPDIRVISLGDSAPSRRILVGLRHDRVRAPSEEGMLKVMQGAVSDYLRSHQAKPHSAAQETA